MVGVIVATERELKALREVLTEEREEGEKVKRLFFRGKCGENEVVLTRCGCCKVNAAICTQAMIDAYHPSVIVNAGAAGALAEKLHILDIVIGKDFVQHDIDTAFFGDPLGWIDGCPTPEIPGNEEVILALEEACNKAKLPHTTGRILSGDQFISSFEKKDWLVKTFDGACVEMEGAAIAQTCYMNNQSYGIIRAISDGSGDGNVMEYEEFALRAARNAAAVVKNLPRFE